MQEGRGGVLPVHHHIVGEALSQRVNGTMEQPLRSAVLAVARSVRLDIEGQGQPGAHYGDQAEVVGVPANLMAGVKAWAAQLTALLLAAAGPGTVDGQTDEAAVVESF